MMAGKRKAAIDALRGMARDYSTGRLGERVPKDRRPQLSIVVGIPSSGVVAPTDEEDEEEEESGG